MRDVFARLGAEVTVTDLPPLVEPAYEPLNMDCPHGVLWHAEPTGEQIAQWVKDGAR